MDAYNRRSFAGSAPDATLSADIDDTTLTVTCDDLTGWPDGTDGPFEVTLEPDTTSEEKCWGDSRSGNTITLLARGMEGSAVAHSATTTTVRHGLSALDMREANYAVSQTVGKVAAKGDIIVGSAANTFTKLGIGTSGQALIVSSGTLAYGKPTLAESDITGLVTDLAGKLATPATAIAKGSLLAGTGANVADSLAVGTDGTVLTADSTATAGVSWQASTSAILGSTSHAGSVSFPASIAALDTTNLKLTFTAPSSGKVLLRASTYLSNAGGIFSFSAFLGWYTHGTTTAQGSTLEVISFTGSSSSGVSWGSGTIQAEQIITGLTAGTSYTLDLNGHSSSTSTTGANWTLTAWAV